MGKWRKFISGFLAVLMVLTVLPTPAYAAETEVGPCAEDSHIWDEGVSSETAITYTCIVCGETREEAVEEELDTVSEVPEEEPAPAPVVPEEEPDPAPVVPEEEPDPAPVVPEEEPDPAPEVPDEELPCEHSWDEGIASETVVTYTCTLCGETKEEAVAQEPDTSPEVPEEEVPCEHSWDEGIASETVVTYTCTLCGETKDEPIAVSEADEALDEAAEAASGFTYRTDNNGNILVGSFEELKELVAYVSLNPFTQRTYVNYDGVGQLTIKESLMIPDYIHLTVHELDIPADVTLNTGKMGQLSVDNANVNGTLEIHSTMEVRGGTLTVTGSLEAYANINLHTLYDTDPTLVGGENIINNGSAPRVIFDLYNVNSVERLESLYANTEYTDPEKYLYRFVVADSFTLDKDVTVPEMCQINIDDNVTVTIPAGVTLDFSNQLTVFGNLENEGTLQCHYIPKQSLKQTAIGFRNATTNAYSGSGVIKVLGNGVTEDVLKNDVFKRTLNFDTLFETTQTEECWEIRAVKEISWGVLEADVRGPNATLTKTVTSAQPGVFNKVTCVLMDAGLNTLGTAEQVPDPETRNQLTISLDVNKDFGVTLKPESEYFVHYYVEFNGQLHSSGKSSFQTGYFSNYNCFSSFKELQDLAAQNYPEWTHFDYTGPSPLVIEEDLSLPENLHFEIEELYVPAGVSFDAQATDMSINTLNIDGSMSGYIVNIYESLTVNGSYNAYGCLYIQIEAQARGLNRVVDLNPWNNSVCWRGDVANLSELKSMIARANADKNPDISYRADVWNDTDAELVINESIIIPENFEVAASHTVIITPGTTVRVNGNFVMYGSSSKLLIYGTLVNNADVYINALEGATMTLETGAQYQGKGVLSVSHAEPEDVLIGLDLSDFDMRNDNGITWRLTYVGNLPKLGTPANLEWGVSYYRTMEDGRLAWGSEERPGFTSWTPTAPYQGEFHIEIFKEDGTFVSDNWNYYGSTDMPEHLSEYMAFAAHEPLPSGDYYFTVTAVGDGVHYRSSEPVKSDIWHYEAPTAKLGTPTDLSWNWPNVNWKWANNGADVSGFEIVFYFAPTADAVPQPDGWMATAWGSESTAEIFDDMVQRNGAGYYSFRVRAVSSDIELVSNSDWSEMSELCNTTIVHENVKGQLDDVLTGNKNKTDEQVRDEVQNIGTDNLKDAMLADKNGSVLDSLKKLEKDAGIGAKVSVSSDVAGSFNAKNISVVGAGLNNPEIPGDSITLEVGKPEQTHVVGAQYDNSLAIQFSMDLGNVDTSSLAVPVMVKLPIPSHINPEFLVLLHYDAEGRCEEVWPAISYENGVYYASILLTHFSDFVLTQLVIENDCIHQFDEGVVTLEPTETEEGILTRTCRICGETIMEPIPVLNKQFEYVVEVEGSGTVTGAGRYADGEFVTLTAKPDKGYIFGGWFDLITEEDGSELLGEYYEEATLEVTCDADRHMLALFLEENVTLEADRTYVVTTVGTQEVITLTPSDPNWLYLPYVPYWGAVGAESMPDTIIEDPQVIFNWENNTMEILINPVGEGTVHMEWTLDCRGIEYAKANTRIDVVDEYKAPGRAVLVDNSVNLELYKDNYPTVNFFMDLPQNSWWSEPVMKARSGSHIIENAIFEEDELNQLFELVVLDDNRVQIQPRENIIEEVLNGDRKIASRYTGSIILGTIEGDRYVTGKVTINIKKTLPKISASSLKFNSFKDVDNQPLIFKGGNVTDVWIYDNSPEWLTVYDDMTVDMTTADLPEGATKASGKLYLMVEVEGFTVPADVTVSASVAYSKYSLGLKSSSVTLSKVADSSNGVTVQLVSKNKKMPLSDMGMTGVQVDGYEIHDLDLQTGTFTMVPVADPVPGKVYVVVSFEGTDDIELPLTVKTTDVTLKAAKTSVTLNPKTQDEMYIPLTVTPGDYNLTDLFMTLNAAPEELDVQLIDGQLYLATTADTRYGMTYKLTIAAYEGAKSTSITIKTPSATKADPSMTIKNSGAVDTSKPDSFVTVTPTFKNCTVSNEELADRDNTKVIITAKTRYGTYTVTDLFWTERKDGKIYIHAYDGSQLDTGATYNVQVVTVVGDDGEKVISKPVKMTVKRTSVKVKLSATSLKLNNLYDETLTVNVSSGTKGFDLLAPAVEKLTDSRGNILTINEDLNVDFDPATLTLKVSKAANTKPGVYKIYVSASGFDKPATLTVTVLSDKASAVSVSMKSKGYIDVIRPGTSITLTPTFKNLTVSGADVRYERCTIRAWKGREEIENFQQDSFIVTEMADGSLIMSLNKNLWFVYDENNNRWTVNHHEKGDWTNIDPAFKYDIQFFYGIYDNEGVKIDEISSNIIKFSLKSGSAKVTQSTKTGTVYFPDRHSQVWLSVTPVGADLDNIWCIENPKEDSSPYEVMSFGNGEVMIRLKPGVEGEAVPQKPTTLNLDVYFVGNNTAKPNAKISVKMNVLN